MRRALWLLLLLTCAGCAVMEPPQYVAPLRTELGTVTAADGVKSTYVLEVAGGVRASLTIVTEYERQRPFLGLRVRELDEQTATARGLEPYSGLLVTGTYPRSAAAAAGVRPGDVLIAIDDAALTYDRHLAAAEGSLLLDRPVTLRIARGREEQRQTFVPGRRTEAVLDPQSVALDVPSGGDCGGMLLRGIPAAWSERLSGGQAGLVVVAAVALGSAAWRAGVRGGDLIDAVDGGAVPEVGALAALLRERARDGGDVTLRLHGEDGASHEASLRAAPTPGGSEVWVPVVVHVRAGAAHDAWTIGPFGAIAGGAERCLADSSRELVTSTSWYAALGLVQYERSRQGSELRLLWVLPIRW